MPTQAMTSVATCRSRGVFVGVTFTELSLVARRCRTRLTRGKPSGNSRCPIQPQPPKPGKPTPGAVLRGISSQGLSREGLRVAPKLLDEVRGGVQPVPRPDGRGGLPQRAPQRGVAQQLCEGVVQLG